MSGHIYKGGLQTYQVAHKMSEQDGPVLTIAEGIIKTFLAKEWTVITPHIIVKLIVESRLNPV